MPVKPKGRMVAKKPVARTAPPQAVALPLALTPEKILAPVPDHYYENIQGWFNFTGYYRDIVDRTPDGGHIVEVGCWKGRSTAFLGVEILRSGKKITLHAVDHFLGSDEEAHKFDDELPGLYRLFTRNMTPCVEAGLCLEVHRMTSADAAARFPDGSVDAVWLDAGHDYASVRADIEAWLPKVKQGGVIGGDDYQMAGVGAAVRDLIKGHTTRSENHWASWWKEVG